MSKLVNHTPFAARLTAAIDPRATPLDVVLVAAAFEIRPGIVPRPLEVQPPVRLTDLHYGDAGTSSVRYEGETAWTKPDVDVLVNGSAYARSGRPVEAVEVRVRLGPLDKRLLVSGDRTWSVGRSPGRPKPFTSMPIVYERAFGGGGATNQSDPSIDTRNPVGVGFQGAPSADPEVQSRVPNIEYWNDRVSAPGDRVRPAGLGVVARSWQPRLQLAGTFDEQWLTDQCPLLPLDFDLRHFQSAPLDQQIQGIRGGEDVMVENMTPDGTWRFRLPELDIPLRARSGRRIAAVRMTMDTVLLEPDLFRVTITLRSAFPNRRNERPTDEYVVGHVSPAWERARLRGKRFFDTAETRGALRGATHFLA